MTIYVPGKLTLKKQTVSADPYYNNVSLLLHGDGTNGSTTITDSSPTPKTVTPAGNAAISTAESKFSGSSIGGTDTRLSVSMSEDFAFGTGDFTLECFYFCANNTVDQSIFNQYDGGQGTGSHGLYLNYSAGSGNSYVFYIDHNSSIRITGSKMPPLNQWTHIAITRASGLVRLFYDGIVESDQETFNGIIGKSNLVYRVGVSGIPVNGYIDDLRITKGVARYTANFTPPTAPFPEVLG